MLWCVYVCVVWWKSFRIVASILVCSEGVDEWMCGFFPSFLCEPAECGFCLFTMLESFILFSFSCSRLLWVLDQKKKKKKKLVRRFNTCAAKCSQITEAAGFHSYRQILTSFLFLLLLFKVFVKRNIWLHFLCFFQEILCFLSVENVSKMHHSYTKERILPRMQWQDKRGVCNLHRNTWYIDWFLWKKIIF